MADIDSNLPTKDSSDGFDGSAAPTIAQQIGGIDGSGNLQAVSVDTSGKINVNNTAQPGVDIGDVTINNASGASAVNIQDGGNSITVDGSVTVTQATGTNLHTVVDSSALPSGASTSALQTTGNTSLSSIDSKTPALGQALAASSVPVVLTAAQISTLTPLTSVTVTQATGTSLHTVVDSSALPAGASTSALQTTTNSSLATISTTQTDGTQKTQVTTLPALVAGSAIIGNIRIDQTTPGTTNGVVVNSSALPSGAATSALQTTINTTQTSGAQKTQIVDASNNAITSTTVGSKQKLDVSVGAPLTPAAPTFATVGVASGTIIVANANRKGLVLINTSSLATISLHLNNGTAVLNSGITLYPHDSWVMDQFTFTVGQINGIASLASTNVSIQELS